MAVQRHSMSGIFLSACLLIIATAVTDCASQAPAAARPAITLRGLTLSREVIQEGNSAVPRGVSSIYRTTDKGVAALVSFRNLYGVIDLRWDWIGPNRLVYLSKQAKTMRSAEGRYFKEFSAWHFLNIAGDEAAQMPGDWSVNVYMNDTFLLSKSFVIME